MNQNSYSGTHGLDLRVNRRKLVKRAFGGVAVAVLAGSALRVSGASAALDDSSHYRTTTDLNLRESPSSSAEVLLVMPEGALVEYLDEAQNGYRYVAYQGTAGWAHEDFLEVSNGGSGLPPVVIGTATLTISANFRTGPSNGHSVIAVLSSGEQVEYTDLAMYGYRCVRFDGQPGWIYEDYLSLDDGGIAVPYYTQVAANLRAEPNTGGEVITVLPAGAQVLDYDGVMENGYRGVDFYGTVGWIYDDYLGTNPPEDGPLTLRTNTAVNLRASSNSSSTVIAVVPAGAEVIDYDLVMENGYRGVDYNGTVGWIFDQYLDRV
jgi:SH3-like domain-containing protein